MRTRGRKREYPDSGVGDGLQNDSIIVKDGTRVGRLDHIFKDLVNIRETQIVQETQGLATFKIVKGPTYDSEHGEDCLRAEIDQRLGGKLSYSIDYVDNIPKANSGKLRLVVSKV